LTVAAIASRNEVVAARLVPPCLATFRIGAGVIAEMWLETDARHWPPWLIDHGAA
jgi:hypothetical protein